MSDISVAHSKVVFDRIAGKLLPFTNFEKYGFDENRNWQIRELSEEQEKTTIIDILNKIENAPFGRVGDIDSWEKGWGEILKEFETTGDPKSLRPQYLRRQDIMRFNGKLVMPLNPEFEANWCQYLLAFLFDTFLCSYDAIWEFGCGTGHNLIQFREWDSKKSYHGFDWSWKAYELLGHFWPGIKATNFNLFKPWQWNIVFPPNTAVLTFGALEQTGQNYAPFIEYLLYHKPGIVVHIEPIIEWYDPRNSLDFSAIRYLKKRGYWSGFPDYMAKLQVEEKVELLDRRRFGVGNKYMEGYMLFVWRPV